MRTGQWQPINHMDWDCQGCERILATKEAFELYDKNVLSMFVAIHSRHLGPTVQKRFQHFYQRDALSKIWQGSLAGESRLACDKQNTKALRSSRVFFSSADGCLKESPLFGPVYYRDGMVRLFNRRLFDQLNLSLRLGSCKPWKHG